MKKTDYQKGYEDGQELVATHIINDGKPKAKEYIKKLSNKNKGKTDAFDYFINNSASYYVNPLTITENNNNTIMKKNKIRLTESQLNKFIKESVKSILKEAHWNNNVYDEFCELREMLGDDTLFSELYNWMEPYEIEQFIKRTKQMYDLDQEEESEDNDIVL